MFCEIIGFRSGVLENYGLLDVARYCFPKFYKELHSKRPKTLTESTDALCCNVMLRCFVL